MAKTEGYKGRGAMLVEDELDFPRPAASSRSRAERDALPEDFSTRYPAKRSDALEKEPRIRRRVPVRKGILPDWAKTRWGRILLAVLLIAAITAAIVAAMAVRSFFDHDPRFRIDSSDSIQTTGNSQLTRAQLLSVFGSDIGRNIFYIPLAQRRAELEQIPWVEHATVMRILPNQLRVAVRERVPVAFVRIGNQIKLVDGEGVVLDMPPAMMASRHFSFPVVTGIKPADPLSERAARMELYQKFIAAIDSTGQHFSAGISEVNLSDPEDLRATVPVKSSDLLLHFGDTNFLARYGIFQSHLGVWQQQYPRLASVDLRYDSEVVLKMAGQGPGLGAQGSGTTAASPGAAKSAKAVPTKSAAAKKAATNKRVHHARGHGRRTRR